MRTWGINIFNSDEVKYTFLTRKLMTVLKGHVLFFMCLLSHHPFDFSCIWVLSVFSLRLLLLLIFFFPPQKNKLLKWRPRIPSQVLGKCRQEKMCRSARLSRLHCATFPAAPHSMFGNVCSCLYVSIPGSHVTIQLQFSSHFATRIGR